MDDVDHAGAQAIDLLSILAARVVDAPTVVIATAATPLGTDREHGLGPLTESDVAAMVPNLSPEAQHALWVASRGLPGVAHSLAIELAELGEGVDPTVHLALHAVRMRPFSKSIGA